MAAHPAVRITVQSGATSVAPAGTHRVGARSYDRFVTPEGRAYVRSEAGDLLPAELARVLAPKHYPLPEALRAVAAEVMGGADPLTLTEDERIARLAVFVREAVASAQSFDPTLPS